MRARDALISDEECRGIFSRKREDSTIARATSRADLLDERDEPFVFLIDRAMKKKRDPGDTGEIRVTGRVSVNSDELPRL